MFLSVAPPPGLLIAAPHRCGKVRRRGKKASPSKWSGMRQRHWRTLLGVTAATVAAGFASAVDVLLLGNCGLMSIFSVDWSQPAAGRMRDIFPLPEIQTWPSTVMLAALKVANLCIAGLNAMWADFKTHRLTAAWRSAPTVCQLEAQKHVAARRLTRLQAVSGRRQLGLARRFSAP